MQIFMLILLMAITVILKWFDCITTYIAINHKGRKVEKNPFARFLMNKFGVIQTLVLIMGIHTTIVSTVAIPLALFDNPVLFIIINGLLILVVINNLYQLKRNNISWKELVGNVEDRS